MANARGIAFMGVMRFVKQSYGADAHDKVIAALPVAHCASFLGPLRDASWKPLRDLAAYTETARLLFAPQDPDFYLKLGRFTGRVEREKGGFSPMVADPPTAMRLAPVLWSSLYDVGSIEFEVKGPKEGIARIHGFRTSRQLCQANRGALEGLVGTPSMRARVEETACVLDGSPYCEMHIVWE